MLSRHGVALMALLGAVLLAGVPNGNLVLVVWSIVPASLLGLAMRRQQPTIEVRLRTPEGPFLKDQRVPLEVHYRASNAVGILEIHVPLPAEFQLLAGSNVHVATIKRRRSTGSHRFVVTSPRRGNFTLDAVDVRHGDLHGLTRATPVAVAASVDLAFRNRIMALRQMPGWHDLARSLMPDQDAAKTGVRTTDFKDLRAYVPGDPPKSINWKQTAKALARAPAGHAAVPLVNEYEHEGRRAVWLFLDCHPRMAIGSNIRNGFELATEGIAMAARYFLDRGFRVGFSTIHHPSDVLLRPDRGRRQWVRIRRVLHDLEVAEGGASCVDAVQAIRSHVARGGYSFLIFTRSAVSGGDEETAIRRLRALTARRQTRRASPVIVLSPDPYDLVPGPHYMAASVDLQRARLHPQDARLRRAGAQVLTFDHQRRSIHAVLAKGGAA